MATKAKEIPTNVAVEVATAKVKAFQDYIANNNIEGFVLQDFKNDVHAHAFRSNLAIEGQNLPFLA